MQRFKDLPLAGRLGLGFGAIALALVVVAMLAGSRMGVLGADVRTLEGTHLHATDIAGRLATRSATIGTNVVQHLYVHDGDLEAEDALAATVEKLGRRNDADGKRLATLLAGSADEDDATALAAARETFTQLYTEALKRSRQETVDAVEERDGSRDFYLEQVAPAEEAVTAAATALQNSVGKTAGAAAGDAGELASSARRTIMLVALFALIAAAGSPTGSPGRSPVRWPRSRAASPRSTRATWPASSTASTPSPTAT